jgi:hypothetical protein
MATVQQKHVRFSPEVDIFDCSARCSASSCQKDVRLWYKAAKHAPSADFAFGGKADMALTSAEVHFLTKTEIRAARRQVPAHCQLLMMY